MRLSWEGRSELQHQGDPADSASGPSGGGPPQARTLWSHRRPLVLSPLALQLLSVTEAGLPN